MFESVLLQLNDDPYGEHAIHVGVELARQCQARVRGLTLLDTRRLDSTLSNCEGAIYATGEFGRLHQHEQRQRSIRLRFCQICLSAGVDFDVRCRHANPLEVICHESRFHDLILAACPAPGASRKGNCDSRLAPQELVDLLLRGVQPMLIVRGACSPIERVLFVCDGTNPSIRAIRTFLQQGLFPCAETRLLAIGRSKEKAQETLREMATYCRSVGTTLETGYLCGSVRKVLVPYAEKWRADLVVLGVPRRNRLLNRVFGDTARDILKKSQLALYALGE